MPWGQEGSGGGPTTRAAAAEGAPPARPGAPAPSERLRREARNPCTHARARACAGRSLPGDARPTPSSPPPCRFRRRSPSAVPSPLPSSLPSPPLWSGPIARVWRGQEGSATTPPSAALAGRVEDPEPPSTTRRVPQALASRFRILAPPPRSRSRHARLLRGAFGRVPRSGSSERSTTPFPRRPPPRPAYLVPPPPPRQPPPASRPRRAPRAPPTDRRPRRAPLRT